MRKINPQILAIETSCDETAAAVLIGSKIASNVVYSQLALHRKTLGIVPEVASRAHTEKIIPVIKQALSSAKVRPLQLDAIAVTVGPGLVGSLLVGVDTAKTLAYIYKKPIIPINHIEAHLYANFVAHKIRKIRNPKSEIRNIFPSVVLIVSGGHTLLIVMSGHGKYKIIGSTIDDAAGEAFDKAARILGLGYPGGPAIEAAASMEIRNPKFEIRNKSKIINSKSEIQLPRPMIDSDDFNFSFSGLKTAVLYAVRKQKTVNSKQKTTVSRKLKTVDAAEFQRAVVEVLVKKTIKAAKKFKAKSIMIGGGVAANRYLRRELEKAVKNNLQATRLGRGRPSRGRTTYKLPPLALCTDNAAVVGLCAYYKYLVNPNAGQDFSKVKINLNSSL